MYPSSGHPRCRWVCFFIRTDLEKFNITLKCYLVWIRREICTDQTPFKRKNRPKQICGWIFDVRGQQGMYFFTRGSIIMDYGLVSDALKLKPHDDGFVSYKHAAFGFTRCYLMDWSGVDYLWIIVMFLSAVWTLILTAPIHCRASIGEQIMECYISPNLFWWRNKRICNLDGLRVSTLSVIFIFNYFLIIILLLFNF